jgi:hypothetical protein
MRLVTWNCCRGPFEEKVALLNSLSPDVVVMQECGKPRAEDHQTLWFGDNPRTGLGLRAFGSTP